MRKEVIERQNSIIKYFLFILNPFFGLFLALKDLKSKSSHIVFLLFIILFGMCFTVPSGRTADFTGDGAVYRYRFDRMAIKSDSEFKQLYKEYTAFNEGEKDFYVTIVSYVISRVTTNYHWIFTFFAFVFGFFMLKSFKFLTDNREFDRSLYCFALALIFIMSNSMLNINGLRFWTAAWIAVYCIFQIIVNQNKRYFLLAAITPFVHVAFFLFLLVLVVAHFTKNKSKFWFIAFLISFFVSSFAQELLKIAEEMLPAFISRTISLYTDEDTMAQRSEKVLWVAKLYNFLETFVVNIVIIVLYYNKSRFKDRKPVYNLFLFVLVWVTFVNFTITIPSLGGRFLHLALPLIAYIWLFTLKPIKKYNFLILIFLLGFSMDFLYQLRMILKVTEIDFYIFSPIYLIYNQLF